MVRKRSWPLLLGAGVAFGIFSLSATPAFSTVIQADDPVFGEKALIRDLDNKRDWLRLDFTTPLTFNEVRAQLGPGGTFEGWAIAAVADLDLLGKSAGIVHGSTVPAVVARAEELRNFFCFECVNTSDSHIYARGLVSNPGPNFPDGSPSREAFSIGRRINVEPNEADFRVSGFGALDDRNEEIFLVRDTVATEPFTEPNEAISREVRSQAGACGTVRRILGERGRTREIIPAEGSGCFTTQEALQITINGVPVSASGLFVSPDAQITFEGSHKFCWASTTTGQMTCIQTPPH